MMFKALVVNMYVDFVSALVTDFGRRVKNTKENNQKVITYLKIDFLIPISFQPFR